MEENKAREEFLKKYRTNVREIQKNEKILKFDNYLRPEDRIPKGEMYKVIDEMSKSLEREKRKKRENERKRRLRKNKISRRAKLVGNVKKVAIVLGAIGIVIAGENGIKNAYDTYQQQNAPITLEQALENGESLDSLGIDNNILLEMQDIEEMLKRGDLTNEEIIKLAPRINELQFDTAKTKLANTLGVTGNEIRLYTRPIEEGKTRETVEIIGGETYKNKDPFTWENTISPEIADHIVKTGEMQYVKEEVKNGNINREAILKTYEEMMKATSQFAAGIVKNDGNGNLSLEHTRQKDIETKQEESTMDEEPEL